MTLGLIFENPITFISSCSTTQLNKKKGGGRNSFCVGVLEQGSWRTLKKTGGSVVENTIKQAPSNHPAQPGIQHSAKVPETLQEVEGLNPIPARPHKFVLHLQHFGNISGSKSAVEEACNLI